MDDFVDLNRKNVFKTALDSHLVCDISQRAWGLFVWPMVSVNLGLSVQALFFAEPHKWHHQSKRLKLRILRVSTALKRWPLRTDNLARVHF
jgi:hypothetical protein